MAASGLRVVADAVVGSLEDGLVRLPYLIQPRIAAAKHSVKRRRWLRFMGGLRGGESSGVRPPVKRNASALNESQMASVCEISVA